MALLLAEEVERADLRGKIKLKCMVCGSETRSEKMRLAIESKLGLEGCYDIGGMTEMYGPGTAIDCDAHFALGNRLHGGRVEHFNDEEVGPVVQAFVGIA
ncbi:phenylacetate--CoA ligase family protein, partial [Desulfovibrio desulfuricans]|nr:phenylacetate--CoA ligase family protein [Desulfovibrio desulfuricans]